jgi:hypothetical protein
VESLEPRLLLSGVSFSINNIAAGASPFSVATGDFNGDTKTDLVVANNGSNTVSIFPGNGDGSFGAKTDLNMGKSPAGVAAADLNGDGKLDLVVTHTPFGGTFTVAFGNGDGSFGTPTTYTPDCSYPVSICITDFNGDQKPDIAVAGEYSVSIFLNNGSGAFTAGTSIPTGAPPWSMSVADLNADGKADLLLPNHTSDSVTVFWGNGDGTFLSNTDINAGTGTVPYAVIATDVNHDNKLDLVSADSGTTNSVSVMLNNGNGTFGTAKTFAAGSAPYSVAALDVNGDGNLDLVTANNLSNDVSLLLGNGDGTFGAPTSFTVGTNPSQVITATLDGNPDLVVTNEESGNISILLGTTVAQSPTVTASPGGLSYTQGSGIVTVDPGLTVSAPASTNLTGATVRISSGYVSGQDALGFVNQNGIIGTWNGTLGVLTLSGTSSVDNYQAALESVTYINTASSLTALTRTVSFVAGDGTLSSAPANRTITVLAASAPVVTPSAGVQSYTPGAGAVAIDPGLTVSDASGTTLAGATVTISGGYFSNQDVLAFTNAFGITASWNATTGTLTLSGSSAVGNYQAALRLVTYNNTSADPSTLPRTITFVANNGTTSSTPATRTLSLASASNPPVVTSSSGALSYTEGTGAVAVDSGITVTDPGSGTLVGATVAISSPNYVSGQDVLGFTSQNGITGSWSAATGVLTLSGGSSVANYQAALQSVTYTNTSATPSTLARSVSFVVNDGAASSAPAARTITVATTTAPVVITSSGALSYLRGSGAVAVDSGIALSDLGNPSLTGATVTISSGFVSSQDVLGFVNQNGITGIWNASAGTLTLSGASSVANYQAALRSVTFSDTSLTPNMLARTIRFVASDGGAASTPATRTVNVTVPPVLMASAGAMSYSQGTDPAIDSGITLSDVESTSLVGATISITGGFLSGQDALGFVNQNGITGSWTAGTGVLTLSGTATLAQYQSALQSVTYLDTATAPNTQDRTVTFVVNDGILASAPATKTVQLTLVLNYKDLTGVLVGGTSWTIPSKPVVAGKAFAGYAQVKVSNIGNGALPLSQTVIIQVLAQDTSNPANSFLLATSGKLSVSKLAANGSVTFRQYVSVPKGLPAGNYQIVVNITPANLTESRTDNNLVSLTAGGVAEPLTVAAQVVDLTAAFGGSMKLPNSRLGGDGSQIYVPVVVKNIGNVALPSGQKIDIEIEATGNGGTTLLKTLQGVSVSSLGALASGTFGTYVTLPISLSPGTYSLMAVVDSSQKVAADPNRNNNSAVSSTTILVGKGYVDLSHSTLGTSTLHSTISTTSAPSGTVSVVMKNTGNVPLPAGQTGTIRVFAHNTATNTNITLATFSGSLGAALAVNATRQFTLSVKNLPAGTLPAGSYTIQATLSPDNMADFNSSIYTALTNSLGHTLNLTVTA